MGLWALRLFLFFACGLSGYVLARSLRSPGHVLWGMLGGFFIAALTLFLETRLRRISLKKLIAGFVGLFLGIMIADFIVKGLIARLSTDLHFPPPLSWGLYAICSYIGLRVASKKAEEFHLPGGKLFAQNPPRGEIAKILDTSVIIDGRIADIAETDFLEGSFLIPQFVLNELQHIADSPDPIKRTRGKRGLEVLRHMQKQVNLDVEIVDTDYPFVKEVDSKLIELAKEVRGKIVTNDSNLIKVAELQGINVLNINELANSLKPVVLPGEDMSVKIVREGKETGQGVAYLDDGTMIVIDNGRRNIGRTMDVTVTSVLQTPAGRMIFARLKEDNNGRETRGKDYYPLDSEF